MIGFEILVRIHPEKRTEFLQAFDMLKTVDQQAGSRLELELFERINKPTFIYFFSDYDEYGVNLSESVRKGLKRMGLDVHFERVGLTKDQITQYNVSMRKTKDKYNRDGTIKLPPEEFKDGSAEMDALPPIVLQELIQNCITKHMTVYDLEMIKMEEEVQRKSLEKVLNRMKA